MSAVKGEVDPFDEQYRNKPLWIVYGHAAWLQLLCCKVLLLPTYSDNEPVIWGYSVYRNEPGFRTLGIQLKKWIAQESTGRARFFADQALFLEYVAKATTPKLGA